jgi:hypothetical protein
MEDLIRLVSECLARHGLLPARDLQPGESALSLGAAPRPEALPEHNYRKISPPDPASLRASETVGCGTAAL